MAIGAGLLDLAKDAAPVEGITNAFDALATSAGKSSKTLIDAMKKQSMGLVDDTDLMLQYNKASQVMGSTLAGQLPDAYQYLAKVAASSGQQVGDLMDTLVQGVGRVTPRMMTQLGVTVDMEQANKDYAKSIGKNVDQLTKADKQTAIFNATMEALKKNTAAMPDVTNNASTKMQQFNVKMEDIKETVGVALLPMLGQFMDLLGKLADKVLPIIVPLVEQVGAGFETFFKALNDGVDPLTAIADAIFKVFGQNAVSQTILDIVNGVKTFIGAVQSGVDPLTAFASALMASFGSNETTQGIVRFLLGFKSALDPILEPLSRFISALVAGISPGLAIQQLLHDLLPKEIADGIITAVTNVGIALSGIWTLVQPALQGLWLWFTQNGLPFILQALSDFKTNFIDPVITKLGELWGAIKPKFDNLPQTFADASTAAKELANMGIFLVVDTLNKAAISAGLLIAIIEIAFITVLHNLTTVAQGVVNVFIEWYNNHKLLVENLLEFVIALGAAILLIKGYTVASTLAAAATGVSGLAGAITAAVTGAWAAVTAFTAAALPVVALAAAIYALIKAYQALQTYQSTVQNAQQGSMDATRAAIRGGMTRQQYLDKAFAETTAQMGDLGGRAWWAASGNAMFNNMYTAAYESQNNVGHALGMKNVPEDGLYKLHKGEGVTTAAENQYGGNSGQIAINFYGGNGVQNAADASDAGFMVVSALRQQGMNI